MIYHGNNLEPEGLETGEFKVGGTAEFDELNPVAIIAYTRNPKEDGLTEEDPLSKQGVIANGIPNGMYFCIATFDYLQGVLGTIKTKGFSDSIMTIFTVPAFALIGFNNWTLEDINSGVLWWLVADFKANPITKSLLSTPSNLDGYTPRNQKLRTYPYMYLGFNPTNGSSKIYRYENFENGQPVFDMYSEINQNPCVCFIPKNYRGADGNSMSDMATMQGYPTLGWVTDYYNTWLAQNSEIINLQMRQEEYNYEFDKAKNITSNIGNVATSLISGIGSILGGGSDLTSSMGTMWNAGINTASLEQAETNHFFYIYNQMAQKEKQAMLPNQGQMGSSNATLLGYELMNDNIFTRYTIKKEFAEKIDKYFDMYGYLTNTVKIPNIKNRPNWNYVKLIGSNIIGNIPQGDLQIIKNIFDTGVTLWHNPETFLDYSQNNR